MTNNLGSKLNREIAKKMIEKGELPLKFAEDGSLEFNGDLEKYPNNEIVKNYLSLVSFLGESFALGVIQLRDAISYNLNRVVREQNYEIAASLKEAEKEFKGRFFDYVSESLLKNKRVPQSVKDSIIEYIADNKDRLK